MQNITSNTIDLAHREVEDENDLANSWAEIRALLNNVIPENVESVVISIVAKGEESILEGFDQNAIVGLLGSEHQLRENAMALNEHFARAYGNREVWEAAQDDDFSEFGAEPEDVVKYL